MIILIVRDLFNHFWLFHHGVILNGLSCSMAFLVSGIFIRPVFVDEYPYHILDETFLRRALGNMPCSSSDDTIVLEQ